MRNLTIRRNKSFVGCAMKDQVYIRDEAAAELTINGVPCRKLGELKNGEEKTFPIGEDEQQIFLIADKLSKSYCNAVTTVPAGQEDVSLSGTHKFAFGSNPFRFEGVALSPEQLAQQRKNSRKGMLVTAAAIVIGLVVGILISNGLFGENAQPKTFGKQAFQITLTDEFRESVTAGYFATYQTSSVAALVNREDAALLGDITLTEYAELILEANARTDIQMQQNGDFLWFDYTEDQEAQDIYGMVCLYQSADTYWMVNFLTPAENQQHLRDDFLQWGASVKIRE